jgi:hypothetical protein
MNMAGAMPAARAAVNGNGGKRAGLFAFGNPGVCFTPRMLFRIAALLMLLAVMWPGTGFAMGKSEDDFPAGHRR